MRDGIREHKRPLQGLAYLLVVSLLVWLSIVAYNKAFPWQRTIGVTLTTSMSGLELSPLSDVKFNGVLAGEVRSITSNGQQTNLHLALDPSMATHVPANVDAQIIPKTLFGEKYVNLLVSGQPSTRQVATGDKITQTHTSVEIGELFNHLQPVLQTLKPAQLSLTLNSLAHALQGRGESIGHTIALLHRYLSRFNPHLPTLVHDIRQLGTTADIYTANVPALLQTLRNTTTISRKLLVPHEQSLAKFLQHTITAADQLGKFARVNGNNVVKLTGHARPVAQVLADYSSELPCLIRTLNTANTAFDHVLGGSGPYLRVSIDLITQRQPYKYPRDYPSSATSDANNRNLPANVPSWAPHCTTTPVQLQKLKDIPRYGLANHARPAKPEPDTRSTARRAPHKESRAAAPHQRLASSVAGERLKRAPHQVPGVATLLVEPLLQQGKVSVP